MGNKFSLKHCSYRYVDESSDKSYDLVLISNSSLKGEALLVKRWGKTGSTGQAGASIVSNHRIGNIEFTKIDKSRESKRYEKTGSVKHESISRVKVYNFIDKMIPNEKGCREARDRIENFLELTKVVVSPNETLEVEDINEHSPDTIVSYTEWGTW